jgi:flagellar motor switch protein FliM
MAPEKILEPAEIDALIKGVNSGAVSTQPGVAPAEARPYDFTMPQRTVRTKFPALELIDERFARALRQSLTTLLRRPADVTAKAPQIQTFADYLRTLKAPTSLNLVRFTPLRGTALLTLDARLVFALVDQYFGGSGRAAVIEGREFTATEQRIIHMLLRNVFADLREAWGPVADIELEFVQSEVNPHMAAVDSPTEIALVSAYQVELAGNGGALHVALPYSMIEPLRETLSTTLPAAHRDRNPHWSHMLMQEVEEAAVELRVQLTQSSVTLAQLLNLKADDILPCDFAGKVTLCAEEIPLFRGSFGLSRGQQAVKIEERLRRSSLPEVSSVKV